MIGAGSMSPEILEEHIKKCKAATSNPFGVNLPLLFSNVEQQLEIIVRQRVKIVFTSAGNPMKWTSLFHEKGIKVVQVIANVKSAMKCMEAGVDAIVAEGFEAGGHNGKEETTTFTLIPLIRQATDLPLIAAGGIATGRGMLAAMILGADAVQIGSRFAASVESSAHPSFKQKIIEARDGDTYLTLRKSSPVRLLKNKFFSEIHTLEQNGASQAELEQYLGKGRAKKGMFEGDLNDGELEIGQISAMIDKIQPAAEIVQEIMEEYIEVKRKLCKED